MIDPIEVYCDLQGPNLDVRELEKQLSAPLRSRAVLGQIADRGRYKGRPYTFGACAIEVPKDIDYELKAEWLADYLTNNMTIIRKCGAEDVVFWIIWRGIQGNMELTVKELQKIATLDIPMAMNYYYLTDNETE